MNNKISTIIIHLTSYCNLECSYCYLQKSREMVHLTDDTIDFLVSSIRTICEYNKMNPIKIIFHGGEPLIINVVLFEKLLNKLLLINPKLQFGIQSNLTLLTEEYIRLFQRYRIRVGFSLDGFNEIQNKFRTNKNKETIYLTVWENYLKLKNNNVKCGAIISLNKYHLGHERELLDFIQNNQLKCNIRPVYPTLESDENYTLTPHEYAQLFNQLFDIWFFSEKYDTFLVSEFVNYIKDFISKGKIRQSCTHRKECSTKYICIDPNGNCYPCNRVYGIKNFYLGNLLTNSIDKIMENAICKTGNRWTFLSSKECKDCEILDKCFGGCGAIAYTTKGNWYTKDYYCESIKLISKHIENILTLT